MPAIIRELTELREQVTLSAAAVAGDIIQTPDGLAAIICGLGSYQANDVVSVQTDAIVSIPAASATTIAAGARVGFVSSTKLATSAAGDFAVGGAYQAKVAGTTNMLVRLNRQKIT